MFTHQDGFIPSFWRLFHEPFKANLPKAGLEDSINVAWSHDIAADNFSVGVFLADKGFGKFCQDMDMPQGFCVEDSVRVGIVDHPKNNNIMEGKLFFHLVVKHTSCFIFRKHVFRICVHLYFDDHCAKNQGENHHDCCDQLRMQ